MKAWLITWEGTGVTDEHKLVGMYSFRRGDAFICELIEFLYLSHYANASQMSWLTNRPSQKTYKARGVFVNNVPVAGRVTCGRDPCIYARLVSELDCLTDEARDMEILTWREPAVWDWEDEKKSNIRKVNDGPVRTLARPARAIRYTRFNV